MTLRVIIPPAPIMVPTDISSSYDVADPAIIALIAAATEEIDGPEGWLGRAIGPQTIELATDVAPLCYDIWLPCPPLVSIISVKYIVTEHVEQTLDPEYYTKTDFGVCLHRGSLPHSAWLQHEGLRIRYQAGYNGVAVADGGTGAIPARIKQAIIYSVQQLSALGAENLFLSSESVEGIGQTSYVVSPNSELLIRSIMDRLLGGLRVYR